MTADRYRDGHAPSPPQPILYSQAPAVPRNMTIGAVEARLAFLDRIAQRAQMLIDTIEKGEQITQRTLAGDLRELKALLAQRNPKP